MKKWGLVMRVQEGGLRRNASSDEQSRGQKVCSAIQSNVSGDSIDKNTHHKSTRQKGTMKYLRESYHHCIKYFVTNYLAVLMLKWHLNSNFQSYSYSQRLHECADGTWINTRNPVWMWRVKMKEGKQYKRERIHWGGGIRDLREKYCSNKNETCNQIQKNYV